MSKTVRVWFLVCLFNILHFLLRLLPARVLLRFMAWGGEVAGRICRRELSISCAQLRLAFGGCGPKSSPSAANAGPANGNGAAGSFDYTRLSLDVFRHVGESAAEVLIWDRIFRTKEGMPAKESRADRSGASAYLRLTASGEELIAGLIRNNQAAVGLSGHFGPFELEAIYLARSGLPLSVIGRRPNYPSFDAVMEEVRRGYGVEMIWRNENNGARRIIQAIHEKRVLAVLIDQDTNLKSGFSPFFGLEAASPTAPLELAVRYRLPVFTCFITRTKPLHYHVVTEQITYAPDDPFAVQVLLDTYNQRLEKLVRLHPEQWIWWHRRWRRRPGVNYREHPELLPRTKDYVKWLEALGQQEIVR